MPGLAPVPELEPELVSVLNAYGRLGRDQNGSPLYAERTAWLREHRVSDPGMREAMHTLWDALDSESAAVFRERMKKLREERE